LFMQFECELKRWKYPFKQSIKVRGGDGTLNSYPHQTL
jgi:hypothetical protein